MVDVHVNKMYDMASPSMDRDPGEWNDIALVRRRTGPLKCLSCSAVFVERFVLFREIYQGVKYSQICQRG